LLKQKEIRMARAKEFRVTVTDKPGALGATCVALAERGVNILAFQSFVEQGESLARFVVDNPEAALEVFRTLRANFEQDDVVLASFPHIPGQLGRVALYLGEHKININYSYCGLQPDSARPLLVFGVDQVTKAAALLDELAAKS
jgi:hypothetical protein